MRKFLAIWCAACAATVFGYQVEKHTNVVERDNVTYVQRGGLGNADYVATNVALSGQSRLLPKYLHLMETDDVFPADAAWFYDNYPPTDGACSARRVGRFLERNYDWVYDRTAEYVVRTSAAADRFASVGLANVGEFITEEIATSGKWTRYFKCLAGRMMDGINENGVCCEINVDQLPPDGLPTAWHGSEIHCLAAVRWVLDHGTNAQQAAEYLADNVYVPARLGRNYHYMVADKTSTYIVENGAAHQVEGVAVMTNYRLYPTPDSSGEGQERAEILRDTAKAITNAWWTLAYDRSVRPVRVSDIGTETNTVWDAWDAGDRESHRGQTFGTESWWQTVHTAIYDLENLTVRVCVQERDDWYTFGIGGSGRVKSVNGKVGEVELNYWDVDALPDNKMLLIDNTNFREAVEAVSPPVELPAKWALANVTNAQGQAVNANDVGAWNIKSTDSMTTLDELYLYMGGGYASYLHMGIDSQFGTFINLQKSNVDSLWLDNEGLMVTKNRQSYGFDWKDLLTLDNVQGQLWTSGTSYYNYPISSKAVREYLNGSYKTELANTFLKSADAQNTYLNKTDASNTYRTKADSYSKTEADERYLSATGVVKKVYSADEKTYQDGDGNVYTLSGGSNWDVYDTGGYYPHMTFYPVGEYRWKTDRFEVARVPEPAYLFPTNSQWGDDRWMIVGESGEVYEYKDGVGRDVDTIRFPILIANKVSAGQEWGKVKTVAYNESVSHLWNADATKYQDADGIVWEKQHDKFVGTESGISPEQDFIWNGSAYYCPDFIYRVSERKPCTLSYIGSGWRLAFQDGDTYTTAGSMSAERLIFSRPPVTYEYRLTRRVPYVAVNKVAYTNDIPQYEPPANYETVSNRAMHAIQYGEIEPPADYANVSNAAMWASNTVAGIRIDHTDTTFSNEVLAVGLNIDTNSVAVLNEIAATFGGFPIAGTSTTVGGLLAALAAAVAMLNKRSMKYDAEKDRYYTER